VLGVLPGIIAMIQATEAVKLLTGVGELLLGRFLHYDALAMRFDEFRFEKDPACPVCGEHPSVTELIDYEGFCGVPQEAAPSLAEISAVGLHALRERGEPHLLLDVREPAEWETAHIEGATLVPLRELPARLPELAEWKDRHVIAQCHSGVRSARACEFLREAGFTRVENLVGGIDAWSLTVDPGVPRY
jgi:adenylyltransferase/sulfurtransferase